jgi:pyruvate dehydrogenase E2 component (dihydrolipoamide acetyltransferase)
VANSIDIVVPDLGDFTDVEIIEVLVNAGDSVAREDGLVTLETDKASMDVPAPESGVVEKLTVSVGDTINTGDVIGTMSVEAGAPTEAPPETGAAGSDDTIAEKVEIAAEPAPDIPPPPPPPAKASAGPAELPTINEAGFARAHASPSVRKLARELGVDLAQVRGSGPKNRVVHDDVKAFVKSILTGKAAAPGAAALPETPKVDFAKFGEIEMQHT